MRLDLLQGDGRRQRLANFVQEGVEPRWIVERLFGPIPFLQAPTGNRNATFALAVASFRPTSRAISRRPWGELVTDPINRLWAW